MLQRVEHGPQYITFEQQRVDRRLLALRRVGMAEHIGEREVGIARGLFRALLEIGQRVLGDVVVFGEHRRHALADDGRRKQLGQRGGHGFEQRPLGAEGKIGADREARRRQRQPLALDRLGVEPERGRQMQPAGDAAAPAVVAVMVLDALAPGGAKGRVLGARQDHGVLARNDRLVAVAVQRPCLHLDLGQQRRRSSGDGSGGGCDSARHRPAAARLRVRSPTSRLWPRRGRRSQSASPCRRRPLPSPRRVPPHARASSRREPGWCC